MDAGRGKRKQGNAKERKKKKNTYLTGKLEEASQGMMGKLILKEV